MWNIKIYFTPKLVDLVSDYQSVNLKIYIYLF